MNKPPVGDNGVGSWFAADDPRRRILVVAPQPFYEDRGTPIAIRQVLRALGELDYPVDLLTYPVGRTIPLHGVRYTRSPNPLGFHSVPIGFSFRKVLLDLAMTPTLAHRLRAHRYGCVHAVEEAAFLVAALRPRHTPLLYDMQSSLPEQLAVQFRLPPGTARVLAAWERWLLRQADVVIASSGLAEIVRRQLPDRSVREWRYSSALPEATELEVAKVRRGLGLDKGQRVILYTGNLASYQGIDALLDAVPMVVSSFPDAYFLLVGASAREERSAIQRVGERVRPGNLGFLPRQPRERISAFLSLSEVCISPRASGTNVPLKVFDYLAARKPIVATNIQAHRAILSDEHALLVPPTAEGLSGGISRLLSDKALVEQLSQVGLAYSQREFSWKAFVAQVEAVYRQVMVGGRAQHQHDS